MRTILVILASITLLSAKAQTHLPVYPWGLGFGASQPMSMAPLPGSTQKWQLRPSASIQAGYVFYNGGISYLSAPLQLNLYHPLTPNVTAFGGVYIAPTVFSMANPYGSPFQNPGYPNRYNMTINPGIQGGLIYTNDAHTFSISGSVRVEKGSYYPYAYPAQRANNTK
jgi:hypothetical protein